MKMLVVGYINWLHAICKFPSLILPLANTPRVRYMLNISWHCQSCVDDWKSIKQSAAESIYGYSFNDTRCVHELIYIGWQSKKDIESIKCGVLIECNQKVHSTQYGALYDPYNSGRVLPHFFLLVRLSRPLFIRIEQWRERLNAFAFNEFWMANLFGIWHNKQKPNQTNDTMFSIKTGHMLLTPNIEIW